MKRLERVGTGTEIEGALLFAEIVEIQRLWS